MAINRSLYQMHYVTPFGLTFVGCLSSYFTYDEIKNFSRGMQCPSDEARTRIRASQTEKQTR